MSKLLILGSHNYSNKRILKELKKLGHKARIITPTKFNIYISDKKKHDRIYYNTKRIYRNTVDCIIPRIGRDLDYNAASVEQMNLNIGIPSTSSSMGLLNASNKLKSIQLLSRASLLVPATMYIKKSDNFKWMVKKLGGFPIVAKLIRGSQGVGTFILNDELAASTALQTFASLKQHLLLQRFIKTAEEKSSANDIRAIVVNGEVIGAYRRYSLNDDFRSNYSISKLGEKIKLSDEQKEIAVNAAKAVGLSGCAGVDLAENVDNGKTYIYEVNGNFSLFGFEKVTGINAAKKIAEYAIELAENKASDSANLSITELLFGRTNDRNDNSGDEELNFDTDLDDDTQGYDYGDEPEEKDMDSEFMELSKTTFLNKNNIPDEFKNIVQDKIQTQKGEPKLRAYQKTKMWQKTSKHRNNH